MSDREMRDILQSVIHDIDSGQVRVVRKPSKLLRKLGMPALAAAIALGASACPAYGVPEYGAPPIDAGMDAATDATTDVDADPNVDYAAPFPSPLPDEPA